MDNSQIVELLKNGIDTTKEAVRSAETKPECSDCKFLHDADKVMKAYEGAIDCVNKLAEVTAAIKNMMHEYSCLRCDDFEFSSCYTCLKSPKYRACMEMLYVLNNSDHLTAEDCHDVTDNQN